METNTDAFVLIPAKVLNELKANQNKILSMIQQSSNGNQARKNRYITAQEFMDALSISRSTFDLLREENKINVIQKGRKLYLPETEIDRYMNS